jgi:hypothetical protein
VESELALYKSVGAKLEQNKLERFARFLATRYVGYFDRESLIESGSGHVLYGRNFGTINTAFHPYELYDPLAYVAANPVASSVFLNRKMTLDTALYLCDGWFNLYHFYFDVVPQLLMAKDKLPNEIPVIVPNGFRKSAFVTPVLQKLALDKFCFLEQQPGQNLLIRRRLYLLKDFVVNKNVISLLRQLNWNESNEKRGSVFLSRLPASNRSLLNNDEVVGLLQSGGVCTAYAETMSYEDQVALFSSASEILGLHGAGLANMVFMPNDARIMEIIPGGYFAENLAIHYKRLASFLGIAYKTIEGSRLHADGKYELPVSALQSSALEKLN